MHVWFALHLFVILLLFFFLLSTVMWSKPPHAHEAFTTQRTTDLTVRTHRVQTVALTAVVLQVSYVAEAAIALRTGIVFRYGHRWR